MNTYIQLAALFAPLIIAVEQGMGVNADGQQKSAVVIGTALQAASDVTSFASGHINPQTIATQGPQVINSLVGLFNAIGFFKRKSTPADSKPNG